jgi:hypothetical protein
MTARKLSAADAALRERITELSVHIPCGGLRGPLQRRNPRRPDLPVRWQSCRHEDSPEKWEGCDVSREYDLCTICFKAPAGGPTRWSWLACDNCLAVNRSLEFAWGVRPFALGRHSLMNGIGVRGGSASEVVAEQVARLVQFARGDTRLDNWRYREFRRLASTSDPLTDVPLSVWQSAHVPGRGASIDAFERLIGADLPARALSWLQSYR